MALPEMQITDAMRAAAEEMVYGYYMQNHKRHELTPKGATWYYDAKQALIQTAFDANPQHSAYQSKPSGRPGYLLESIRFDDAQRQEAQAAFDQTLQTVVAEAAEKIKGDKVPADFTFKDEGAYYGTGYPPKGVPAELTERGTDWQKLVAGRGDIART
jgi:hypothetical protein